MNVFEKLLTAISQEPIPILDSNIPIKKYTPLDLSDTNLDLLDIEVTNPSDCQSYINTILLKKEAFVAYGGYLEKRNLYADKSSFSKNIKALRNIHLGIDYWAKADTHVLAPISGHVHSFKNNTAVGDYGPTIILSHHINELSFYTLYGHLSLESIEDLFVGKAINQGAILGYLGTPDINVNYAPHLHFQIIKEIKEYSGDYPGVCTALDLDYYRENCPNPNLLLKIRQD